MPKIAAATVAEHREQIRGALVDAAEQILRAGEPLTAGVVSSAAGIARNSIYRYVDSVDDLRGMVLARYLPAWDRAVSDALAPLSDPGDRIVAWVRVNLEQADSTGHSWLMDISRGGGTPSSATAEVADYAHRILRDALGSAWLDLVADKETARLQSALTLGLLQAAFQQLDSPIPTDRVIAATEQAARALVEASRP
ncbi:TetR family transcriptional regulator [Tessaracoccus aquimaris]|uniref:TetR family transcriptional regulator n=1 Tax=Tessaracoccus aquimaris TaxID=1332264 RepID=A0A1Q2CSK8_9ACTN|nr:TetR family transcriptional regulator [Tessaracoccus aquimaris]AQP49096.1 TetR family transcriptional regulator [Tessaracoccus aquimaris]